LRENFLAPKHQEIKEQTGLESPKQTTALASPRFMASIASKVGASTGPATGFKANLMKMKGAGNFGASADIYSKITKGAEMKQPA
jgi:hypothetical protein